jgi:hypothetical protein
VAGNSNAKEALEILEQCRSIGWEIRRDGKEHFKVIPKDEHGEPQVALTFSVASTPSSSRTLQYLRADLKRAGFPAALQAHEKRAEEQRMARLDSDKKRNDAKLEAAGRRAAESSMRVEIVDMTPEWARKLLEAGEGTAELAQRPRKKKTLAMIEAACRNTLEGLPNGWQLTHQGIALDGEGNVIDGGNRLHVLAEQPDGTTWPLLVTYNANPATFTVVDMGSNRTPGDLLRMRGYIGDNHSVSALKLLNLYRRYRAGEYGVPHWLSWRNTRMDGFATLAERELHPELDAALEVGHDVYAATRPNGIMRASTAAWWCIVTEQWDGLAERQRRELMRLRDRFVGELVTGEDIRKGDATYTIREWARNGFFNGPHYDYLTIRERCLVALIKGGNAFFRRHTGQDPAEQHLAVRILKTEGLPAPFDPREEAKMSQSARAQRRRADSASDD